MDLSEYVIASACVGVTMGSAGSYALNRWLRDRSDAVLLREAEDTGRSQPKTLYPIIDADRCIGSLACIRSCPEGDIIGMVDGVGKLIRGQDCIGHGRCAVECPVSAITLVMGTAQRGVDLPELDERFESSRPGVHVVGELGGMGLIKNAMRQGLQVADHLARARPPAADGIADVCIVGAGPAGICTALALAHHGMTYRLLEQEALASTIAHYPRRKLVMMDVVQLPLWGKFGRRRIPKEDLMQLYQQLIRKARIRVEAGVRVERVDGRDGDFLVSTSAGPVRAAKVVLAVGRRGSPRKLGVPGEERPKVVYALDHAEQYDGTRVLVVGAGDSGVEAACQLARESTAKVWLSYRGSATRCREANRQELLQHAQRRRLTLLPSSQVKAIGAKTATVEVAGKAMELPNDYVIVNIGGELPAEFLEKAGVTMRRYHGEPLGGVQHDGKPRRSAQELRALRNERRLGVAFLVAGAALLALVAWRGWAYYVLSPLQRQGSPLHPLFKPSGAWGHGVGIAAAVSMLVSLAYVPRKRVDALSQVWDMRSWLALHVFTGLLGALLVPFHAAFQTRNLLAMGTWPALVGVVLTGIVGRYVFGGVPAGAQHVSELERLKAWFAEARVRLSPLLRRAPDPEPVEGLFRSVAEPLPPRSFLYLVTAYPSRMLRVWAALRAVAQLLPDEESRELLRDELLQSERLRWQIGFYRTLKPRMRAWRILHAALAAFLVFAITWHVCVCFYLGFGRK
jgi:thioredoxin reductase/Pyruvate/2-oxoacid:ferredoxin oxidoreductase delta subunit